MKEICVAERMKLDLLPHIINVKNTEKAFLFQFCLTLLNTQILSNIIYTYMNPNKNSNLMTGFPF